MRSPERSSPHSRTGKVGAGESEGGPKALRSADRVGGGGPPHIGPPYDEVDLDTDARVVPWRRRPPHLTSKDHHQFDERREGRYLPEIPPLQGGAFRWR